MIMCRQLDKYMVRSIPFRFNGFVLCSISSSLSLFIGLSTTTLGNIYTHTLLQASLDYGQNGFLPGTFRTHHFPLMLNVFRMHSLFGHFLMDPKMFSGKIECGGMSRRLGWIGWSLPLQYVPNFSAIRYMLCVCVCECSLYMTTTLLQNGHVYDII